MTTFTNKMNEMVADMVAMTKDTMDFGCKFDECFPYNGSKRIEIDGVTYLVRMNIEVKKI